MLNRLIILLLLLIVPASVSADFIYFPAPTGTTGGGGTTVQGQGMLNVKTYGARGDGTTDDTVGIQKAAADARSRGACVYLPAGRYLITQDLNFTSNSQPVCIVGDDPSNTEILCEDTGGNCLDLSGGDAYSVRNLTLQGGTSAANAPKVVILLARTGNQGYGHTLENVWTSSAGPYTIYDYGAELAQWRNVRSNSPSVVISACNHAGITSKYQALVAPPTSMSVVNIIGGNLNAGGGLDNCAIRFDNACDYGTIHDINIWSTFFGEMGGGGTALCDEPGGTNEALWFITVIGSRMEAADANPNYRFLNFSSSYVSGISLIQDNIAISGGQLAQSFLYFGGFVDNSEIQVDLLGATMAPGVLALSAPGGRANRILDMAPEMMSPVLYLGDLSGGNHIGDDGNYIQWFDGTAPYYGHVDAGGMEANFRRQTVNGTTSGSVTWGMPGKAVSYKVVNLLFSNYQNATATAQNIVYPVTFLAVPTSFGTCPAGLVLTNGTQVSLPASMAAPFTGQCIISGE